MGVYFYLPPDRWKMTNKRRITLSSAWGASLFDLELPTKHVNVVPASQPKGCLSLPQCVLERRLSRASRAWWFLLFSHEGMLVDPVFYKANPSCSDFNTAMPCSEDKVPHHDHRGCSEGAHSIKVIQDRFLLESFLYPKISPPSQSPISFSLDHKALLCETNAGQMALGKSAAEACPPVRRGQPEVLIAVQVSGLHL